MSHDVATQEELTAYLDGELAPETRRLVEERLARDPEFRTQLYRLQHAWDLLDKLPRATVDDSFAKTTMELVAVAAEQEARTQALEIPRRRRRGAFLGVTCVAAAALAGLLFGLRPWSNANWQLLRDLPVLEDFDLYRQADSLEFIRQLQTSKFFDDEAGTTPPLVFNDIAAKRDHIAQLSINERQELLRNQERFNELTTAEQQRLRTLHEELVADPASATLYGVLERYHEWLKTLSPEQRAELADLSAAPRIDRIAKLLAKQKEEQQRKQQRFTGGEPLPPEDVQVIFDWFEELVQRHRDELLASMPANRRADVEKLDETGKKRALMFVALRRWRNEPIPLGVDDFDRLVTRLSPTAREQLEKADTPQRKRHLAREWLFQVMASRWGSMSVRRSLASIASEELERFFQDELPESDQQRLLNLPRDQMRDELRHLYFQRAGRPERPPFDRREPPDFRGGPPRDFPPGERPPRGEFPGPRGSRRQFDQPPDRARPPRPPEG
jgi:hypothetical protein